LTFGIALYDGQYMELTDIQQEYIDLKLAGNKLDIIEARFGPMVMRDINNNPNLTKHLAQLQLDQAEQKRLAQALTNEKKAIVRDLRAENNLRSAKSISKCLDFLNDCMDGKEDIEISEKVKIALSFVRPVLKHGEKLAELSAEKSFADDQAVDRRPLPEVE